MPHRESVYYNINLITVPNSLRSVTGHYWFTPTFTLKPQINPRYPIYIT